MANVSSQMDSMLPAVDDDTRSTEKYLKDTKPMDISSVPAFQRPMDASDNDSLIGEDDAGNPVYRTILGNTYSVRKAADQRTTRTKIEEDVLPAVKNWLQNPKAPSQDQILDIGKSVAESVYNLVSIPADLATGKRSASDIKLSDVYDTTGIMAVGSLPFKTPAGALRTFGGSSMELDDSELSNFKKARELMKAAISSIDPNQYDRFYWANKKVWDETGWYIDPSDKQWRFEIDDSKSKIDWNNANISDVTGSELKEHFETLPVTKPDNDNGIFSSLGKEARTLKLSDFFTHDNLYQRYPFLKDLKVEFYNKEDGFGGSYTPGENLVKININSVKSLDQSNPRFRSILLHEIQHAIQEREGFSKGANPDYIADEVTKELVEKSEALKSEAKVNIRKNAIDLSFKHNFNNLYDYFPLPSDLDKVGKKTYYDLIDDTEATLLEEMGIEQDLQPKLYKLITDTADEYRKYVDAQDLTSNMEFKFYMGADGEVESRLVQATLEDPDYQGTFPLDRANKMMNERDPNKYDEFANTPDYRGKTGQGDKTVRTPDIGEADVFVTPKKPFTEYLPEIDPSKPGYNMEFTVKDEIKAKTAYIKDLFKNQPKLKKLTDIKPGQKFTLNYEDGPLKVEFRHYSFQNIDKKNLRGEGSIIIGSEYDKVTVPTAVIKYPEGNNRQISIMELINRSSLVKDFDIQDLRKTQKSPPGFLSGVKKKLGFAEGGLAESKGLGWGELIVDNILGLDNEYESFGEKLGKAINEDEIKFLKDAAVGVYEGTKEFVQAPVETTKQVVNEIKDSVTRLGSEDLNTRLQRMYGVSYKQATDEQVNQAREAVLGDALTALELVPAAKVTTTVAGAAIPSGLKADVVGQTKAMLSGDREFLSGTPSNRASTQSLSAGFTGQNPPTYLFKDEPPFDPDGIYGTEEGILKFREPIAEFTLNLTRTNSFPSKGMTGAEFLRLLEKNAESIPPSSYKEGLVDKDKRYTREELLDAVTKSPAGLPESIYYNLADLEASPNFGGYQRQTQVGFTGYPRYPEDTSYFSIPILSRTSGNTFKANSQHFDASTTAHVRGSFIDPMVGFNVDKTMSPEFKSIVGKDRPYLLVEEIQSDLLQKGYRKPKNSFDTAFNRAADETMAGSPVTFQEVYGDLTNELKSLVKSLESKGVAMPEEPVRLQLPYRTGVLNHPQFKDRRRRDFVDEVYAPERGVVEDSILVEFEEIKDYIDKQGVNSSHIHQILNDLRDGANRTRSVNSFLSVDFIGPNNKVYESIIVRSQDPLSNNPMYVVDVSSPVYHQFVKDFDGYTKKFGLNYDDLADAYDKELDKYYDAVDKEITDRKLDKDAVDGAFVNGLYERFLEIKKDQRLLGDETNTALPPVRKNKQTVEEALKLLIAKADQQGVDKIVIPPASKIAEARNRTIDPSDKGDRFYRTYVTDLNKALEDLEKNYPVTIHRDVELPYRTENQPTRTAAEQHLIDMGFEDMVNDNPNAVAANAADDAAINDDDDLFFDVPEGFFDDVPDQDLPVQQPKTKTKPVGNKGIIIDISKLREQFQVDKPRQFAEGGAVGDMNRQMELFARGGLKDDGMNVDPVSGNEVPSGSLAEEVRDDIPAQLSEGEYVVPADVVRYYGVKFFEDLRAEAKMGLTRMEANGRIGGEPVEDDLSPQEMALLQEVMAAEQPIGMNEGGLAPYKNEDYIFSPTLPNPALSVPGMSYMTPTTPQPFVQQPVPTTTTPTPSVEYCESINMMYDPETKMCVPKPTVQQESDGDSTPTPTGDGKPAFQDWGEELNFSDFESMEAWAKSLGEPMKGEKLIKGAGLLMGGPGAILAGGVTAGDALKDISDLRAAAIVAKARGDDKTAEMLEGYVEDRIKASSGIVDILDDLVATGTQKADAYAKRYGFDNIEDVLSSEENKKLFSGFTRSEMAEQRRATKRFRPRVSSPGLSGSTPESEDEVGKEQTVMQQTASSKSASDGGGSGSLVTGSYTGGNDDNNNSSLESQIEQEVKDYAASGKKFDMNDPSTWANKGGLMRKPKKSKK